MSKKTQIKTPLPIKKKYQDKSNLYQTNGDMQWYLTLEHNYEGFNKKTKLGEYEINREPSGEWILKGKGKEQGGQFRHELMKSADEK